MADRQAAPRPPVVNGNGGIGGCRALLRRIHQHSPNSSQVVGFLTLALSGAVLLLLIGITVIGATLGFIAFAPLLLMTSPVWVPLVSSAFVLLAGAAAFSGTAVVTTAGATWLYRYFTGRHPIGSDRVDYARSRIADTANHVKDYAREYGGYFQSRIKDAAPGA